MSLNASRRCSASCRSSSRCACSFAAFVSIRNQHQVLCGCESTLLLCGTGRALFPPCPPITEKAVEAAVPAEDSVENRREPFQIAFTRQDGCRAAHIAYPFMLASLAFLRFLHSLHSLCSGHGRSR